jgi:hypothetical protein
LLGLVGIGRDRRAVDPLARVGARGADEDAAAVADAADVFVLEDPIVLAREQAVA